MSTWCVILALLSSMMKFKRSMMLPLHLSGKNALKKDLIGWCSFRGKKLFIHLILRKLPMIACLSNTIRTSMTIYRSRLMICTTQPQLRLILCRLRLSKMTTTKRNSRGINCIWNYASKNWCTISSILLTLKCCTSTSMLWARISLSFVLECSTRRP